MHPTEPARFAFVFLCENETCERPLSGPVRFCPYCGTQLATAVLTGGAPLPWEPPVPDAAATAADQGSASLLD